MGTISFFVPDPLPPDRRAAAESVCLSGGYDLTPVPTRRKLSPGRIDLTRDGSESGYLQVAWPADGLPAGTVTLSSTLRERAEPYHLALELARGRVNRLRCQLAEWTAIGMDVPADEAAELRAVTRRFGELVRDPTAPVADALAGEVLARAHHLADALTRAFAEQLLLTRLGGGRLPTKLAAKLTAAPAGAERERLSGLLTAVRVVPDWAAIEPTESAYEWDALDAAVGWATAAGLPLSLGPILDLAGGRYPAWLAAWAGDLPSLAAFTCDFVETVVRRYQGRVAAWLPVGGFNQADALGLAEDDRIRLAARLLESASRTDPTAELVLSVAQPWGDYLCEDAYTYTPLVFADTLVRAGFHFAALDLELLSGPPPAGSRRRDGLEVFRLFEQFAVLGIPLELTTGNGDWTEAAAGLAVALPQFRQVTWANDDPTAGPLRPDGLFQRLRASVVAGPG